MGVTFTAFATYELKDDDIWATKTIEALRAFGNEIGWKEQRLYTSYLGGSTRRVISEVDLPSLDAYQQMGNRAGELIKKGSTAYKNLTKHATWISTEVLWRRDV